METATKSKEHIAITVTFLREIKAQFNKINHTLGLKFGYNELVSRGRLGAYVRENERGRIDESLHQMTLNDIQYC